jgi:hypothetical protein
MPSAWGWPMTRQPATGAVERLWALRVNVVMQRELAACGSSGVTFGRSWLAC